MKAGMTEFCRKTLSRMTVCPPRRQRSASRRHCPAEYASGSPGAGAASSSSTRLVLMG